VDPCENVRQLRPGTAIYGGDAFWNSYWNLNGLWSLVTPEIVNNWVVTQIELFRHTGWTGKGPTGVEYSGVMEGSNVVALMTAAYQKGIRNYDVAYYGSIPYHGWEGDEDEGQMAAWFVMSAMGLFEMDGGVTDPPMLDLGSPLFEKITITLDAEYYDGGRFEIVVHNNSKENLYIQSATLNGRRLEVPRISWFDVVQGGRLVLEMGSQPNVR